MSTELAQTSVTLVDSIPLLLSLLDKLTNLPTNPPSLYLDLEGVHLGRHGTLSILSLYLSTTRHTYLIDIHTLGTPAFTTTNPNHSLKTLLESPTHPKVLFDLRNDSAALFHHHQISLANPHDLQLMELATRPPLHSKRYLAGLTKCIRHCPRISPAVKADWQRSKEVGHRLFDPAQGGRYEVFNDRPLCDEIVQYCARDVTLLPELWREYTGKLGRSAVWRGKVREETEARVRASQRGDFVGHSQAMALGPW